VKPAAKPSSPDPTQTLIGSLLGLLLGVAGLLWVTGQVAGRVVGGAWPDVAPTEMGAILVAFKDHVGDPGLAWPPAARRLLPGPVGFYTTLGLLAVFMIGCLWWAAEMWARLTRRGDKSRDADGQAAKWATSRQLRPLQVDGPTGGRVILGRSGRHLLAVEASHSVAVVGPSGSLKTTGFAIPAILEWDNAPALVLSVKSDLVRDTIDRRETQGEVWVFDPTAATTYPGHSWSPVAACGTWADAQRMAHWLTSAARDGDGGLQGEAHWASLARMMLAPLLYAAANTHRGIADVVSWVKTRNEAEVLDALEATGQREAFEAAASAFAAEPRRKDSVYGTVETILEVFADPDVAAATRSSEITAHGLLDGTARTLYLCATADEQARLRPLFVALINTVIAAARAREQATGQPLDPPLLMVLDEAASVAPLRDLDELASTARGLGIQLVTIWQDLAQLRARYRDRAHTVLNNHKATVVLSGSKDPATLEHISRLVGDARLVRESTTTDAEGRTSTTQGADYRRLAPDHALRLMPPGEGLLIYGTLPPTRIRLRPWFRDKTLRARSAGSGRTLEHASTNATLRT